MGPLQGIRIVEIAGIGPGPFAAMLLADMGAEIIRLDRVKQGSGALPVDPKKDLLNRGRKSVAVDLKSEEGVELALDLIEKADGLIEGFRPGVMERLGLGPDVCLERNPKLVYGRMTGWGQDGPLADAAGHDINYIALAGVLHAVGRPGDKPVVPLNLAGDFGGGGLYLAFGMVCALLETARSGEGQVIDAAMIDGASSLMTFFHGILSMGVHTENRGTNLLDSGAPHYDVYETSDGKYITIGSLEPQFYRELLERLEITDDPVLQNPFNFAEWPKMKEKFTELFKQKTRDEWCEILEGTDVCFAPVLSMSEAPKHEHMKARDNFVEIGGVTQPAPAPRFSRTQPDTPTQPPVPGEHTQEALAAWGVDSDRIEALQSDGIVRQSDD
jgi:alpha-methylacyl-CoA racemase